MAALLAVAVFLASWSLAHYGFYARGVITDLPVYEEYGRAMVDGEVPYRDFRLEYPPLALPVFALPALADGEGGYRQAFEASMAACGALCVALVALTLGMLRASPARTAAALALVALTPLLLGSVVLSRFDLWPALLVTGALAAFVGGRDRLGSAVLGLSVAAKVYGGVLAPLALAWVWRRHGRREALVCAAIFGAAVVVPFLPFLVVAPEGVAASLERQLSRPLQIESVGSALLLALREPLGYDLEMRSSSGSQNIDGAAGTVVGLSRRAAPGRGAGLALAAVRARADDGGTASPLCGRGAGRLRRARQGALAAVPDLAHAGRRARRRAAAALWAGVLLAVSLVLTQLLVPALATGTGRSRSKAASRGSSWPATSCCWRSSPSSPSPRSGRGKRHVPETVTEFVAQSHYRGRRDTLGTLTPHLSDTRRFRISSARPKRRLWL